MESDCEEWRIWGRKCSTKQKRQSGLSCQGELRERVRERKGERKRRRDGKEMLSALSNNALTTSVAEINSCGHTWTSVTFSV